MDLRFSNFLDVTDGRFSALTANISRFTRVKIRMVQFTQKTLIFLEKFYFTTLSGEAVICNYTYSYLASPVGVGPRAESAGALTGTDPTVTRAKPVGAETGADPTDAGTVAEPAGAGIVMYAAGAGSKITRPLALTQTSALESEAGLVGAALASAGAAVTLALGCSYSFCRNG